MSSIIKISLVLFTCLLVLTGLVYPLLITGVAQAVFPQQANGSLIRNEANGVVGSALIGQDFSRPEYFWGRPSATAGQPYNAAASGGSNYSMLNEKLVSQARDRINALLVADPGNRLPIPVDLITASGSGLDPHISPEAAYYQAGRVARARNLHEAQVRDLINKHIERPFLGIIGEPRVNVLMLNLTLEALQ